MVRFKSSNLSSHNVHDESERKMVNKAGVNEYKASNGIIVVFSLIFYKEIISVLDNHWPSLWRLSMIGYILNIMLDLCFKESFFKSILGSPLKIN